MPRPFKKADTNILLKYRVDVFYLYNKGIQCITIHIYYETVMTDYSI